jgi:hypothetical protein
MGVLAMRSVTSAPRSGNAAASLIGVLLLLLAAAALGTPAEAQRIENGVANFAALDKVSAAVKPLAVQLNTTETFRTLKVTPRACYTRDPSEPPRTATFVEVDEVLFDGSEKRIFTGWMFAESPGLNPLVHPVFDLWLTGCSQPKGPTVSKRPNTGTPSATDTLLPPPRRRPPR